MKYSGKRKLFYLVCLVLIQAYFVTPAVALDPRFILDTTMLDSRIAGSIKSTPQKRTEKPRPAKPGSKKRSSTRGRSGSIAQQYKLLDSTFAEKVSGVSAVRGVWEQLFPGKWESGEGINISGQNFELSLDQDRFPVLPAADGGKLLLDAGGKLPPLVRSLVQSMDDIRVVGEDPANTKRFYANLLQEAHFYSVSENFTVDFGVDSTISVTSDFKIEKTVDSLAKQDVVLLNVTEARSGTPPVLVSFLAGQGFRLIEPSQTARRASGGGGHRIYSIAGAGATEIADNVLTSLDVRFSRDSRVELFGPHDSGIKLDIMADRYYEIGGERYIVSRFNGDPVFYTLMRLLETRGYRVVILEDKDSFKRVAEKLFSRMKLPSRFEKQRLWPAGELPYSVQLPGFMLRDPSSGHKTLLTDSGLDPLVSELASMNGYTVFPSH